MDQGDRRYEGWAAIADRLNRSEKTCRKLRRDHRLPVFFVGRTPVLDERDLKRWEGGLKGMQGN